MPMPEADVYTLGNAYENCGKRILIRLDQNRSTLVDFRVKTEDRTNVQVSKN